MAITAIAASFIPAIGMFLLGPLWGLPALGAAMAAEAVCLLPVRRIESERNRNVCIGIMASGTTAAAMITAGRWGASDPAELGIAALVIALIVHLAAFFTLCGFVLKKKA